MGIKSIDYFGVNFFSFIGFSFFIFLPFSINERDGSILGLIIAVIGMFSFYIGGEQKRGLVLIMFIFLDCLIFLPK
ncbi:hypothetical protein [Edwardsiella tarda]|uniref:hypothetical protein n=1 Tax=Edwardsiella tarda TaxID=636 RepID=UPI00351C1043